MKTAELQGAPLDYWVARAEGHAAEHLEIRIVPRTDMRICVRTIPSLLVDKTIAMEVMAYSTNWAQGGPLIEKHMPMLDWVVDPVEWYVELAGIRVVGATALQAVCRAIVRVEFGDEVEDLSC